MASAIENIQATFGWRLWASIWTDLLPSGVCLTLFLVPACREWLGPFSFLVWANSFLYLLVPVDGGSMLLLLSGLSLLSSMLLGAGIGVLAASSCRYNPVGLVVWLAALIFVRLLARGTGHIQSPLLGFANVTPAYAFLVVATAHFNEGVTLSYLGYSMVRAAFITWSIHLVCRFLFGYTRSTNAIMREHMSDILEGLADMLRSTARLLVDSLDEQAWHVPASLTAAYSEPYDVEVKPKGVAVDDARGKDILQSTEFTSEQDLYRQGPKPYITTASSIEINERATLLRQLRFTLREAIVDMPQLEKFTKWSCRLLFNGQYAKYHQLAKVLTEACWLVLEVCVYHPKNNTEPMAVPPPLPFIRNRPARRSPHKQKDPAAVVSPNQPPPEFVRMWGSQREIVPPADNRSVESSSQQQPGASQSNGLQYTAVKESPIQMKKEKRRVDSFPVEDDVDTKVTPAIAEEEDDDTAAARTAPTPVAEGWEEDRHSSSIYVRFNQLFRSSRPYSRSDFRLDTWHEPSKTTPGGPIAEADEEEDNKPSATTSASTTTDTQPATEPAATPVTAEPNADASTTTSPADDPIPSTATEGIPAGSAAGTPTATAVHDTPSTTSTPKGDTPTGVAAGPFAADSNPVPSGTPTAAATGTPTASGTPTAARSGSAAATPEGKVPTSPEEFSPSGLPRRRPGRILEAVESALKKPEDSHPPGHKPPALDLSEQGTPSASTPKPPTPTFELKPSPSGSVLSPAESSRALDTASPVASNPYEPSISPSRALDTASPAASNPYEPSISPATASESSRSDKWGRVDSGKSTAFGKLAAKFRAGLTSKKSKNKTPKEDPSLQEVKVVEREPSSKPPAAAPPAAADVQTPEVSEGVEAGYEPTPIPTPFGQGPVVQDDEEPGSAKAARVVSSVSLPASAIPGPPELRKELPSEVVEEDKGATVLEEVPPAGSVEIPMYQQMYRPTANPNRFELAQPQRPLVEPPSPTPADFPEPSPSPLRPLDRPYTYDTVERNEVPRSTAATAVANRVGAAAALAGKKDKRGKKGRRREWPAELASLDEDSPVDAELPEMDQMRLKGRALEGKPSRKSRLSNRTPSMGKHDLKTSVATFADEVAGALDIMAALVAPVPLAGHLPPSLVDWLEPEYKLHPRQHPRRVNAMTMPVPDIEHGSLSPATKQLVDQALPGKSAHVEMVLTLRPLLKAQMQVAEKAYERLEQQLLQALHKAGGPLKAAQSSNAEQALNVMYFFSFSRYMLNTFYPLGDAVRHFTAATCSPWSPSLKDWFHQPTPAAVIPPNWKHNTPPKSFFSTLMQRLHLRNIRSNLADLRENLRITLLVTVIAAIGFGAMLGWTLPHPLYGFSGLMFVSIMMAMPWSVTGVLMTAVYMFVAWMGILVSMIVWATSRGDKHVGGTAAWFMVAMAFLSFVARALPDAATASAVAGLFLAIPVAGYMNSMPVGGPRMEEALGGWYGAPRTGFYRFASLHLAFLLITTVITILTLLLIFPRLASRKIKEVEASGSKELLILCTSQQLVDNELRERCYTGEFQTPAEVQEAVHLHQRGLWQLHGNFMAQLVQYNRLVQSAWEEPSFYGVFNAGLHRDLNMYMSKASNASMALCVMLLRPLLAVSAKEQSDDQMLQGFQKEVVAHPLMNGDLQRASMQLLQAVTNSLQDREPLLFPAIAPALKFHLSRQTQGFRDAIQQLSSHSRHPISVSNWNEALGRVWIEMLLLLHLNSSVELNKAIRGAARACRELHGYILPPPPALLAPEPMAPLNGLYSGQQLQIVSSIDPGVRSGMQT